MSKGKERSHSTPKSPNGRKRTRQWTDETITAILDAAPSDTARSVLLANPSMMKALLRKASRHVEDDSAVDVAILKRILAEDDPDPANLRDGIRQREVRLEAEMLRAAEAERRLLEAQAKVNALILEKQQANSVADRAREEALRIKLSLDTVNRDIDRRNHELQRLEKDFDELNDDFSKIRQENRHLKLREAREAGREEGRRETRKTERRDGSGGAFEDGYGRGYDKGYKELADRLIAELAKQEAEPLEPIAQPLNPQPFNTADAQAQALGYPPQDDPSGLSHHRQDSSGDAQPSAYRDAPRHKSDHQRRPSRSDAGSISMPVPQHFAPPPEEEEPVPEPEPPRERIASPPRASSTRPSSHGRHRRENPGPSEAEQIKNAYRAPVPTHNAPSPRPHPVEVPLDDIYVPVLDASGHIDVPPAHEWQRTTPTQSIRELPQSRTPAQSPRLFGAGGLPNLQNGAAAPPSKTPKTTASSVRSRAASGHEPRSRSPDHSTPLSQFSILHEEPAVPPITIPVLPYRNRSVLSVIHEQSDGDSPVTRMQSMSPSRRNPYEPPQPMPNVPYLAAAPNQGMAESSVLDGRDVEIPVPHRGSPVGNIPMPEVIAPNPGQPRVRQYDEIRQMQNTGRSMSPVRQPYTYEPAPLPPEAEPFVPFPTPQVEQPFHPPIRQDSKSSRGKKGKKGKSRFETEPEPEPEPAPPVVSHVTPSRLEAPAIMIRPPSDKSESEAHRYSQISLQPQRLTPYNPPSAVMDSDSEDSAAIERNPPAFIPRASTPIRHPPFVPPPVHEPPAFIPPPPPEPEVEPEPQPVFIPPPIIKPESKLSKKQMKKKGKQAQQAATALSSRVPSPVPMPVPMATENSALGAGDVVLEPPPNATMPTSFPPGTVMAPIPAIAPAIYEAAPPPLSHSPAPAFVPTLRTQSPAPQPFIPPTRYTSPIARHYSPAIPPPLRSQSPAAFVPSQTRSPSPSYATPLQQSPAFVPTIPEPEVEVIPEFPSVPEAPISTIPTATPRAFIPPTEIPDAAPIGYTARAKKGKKGKKEKAPLGRPNPGGIGGLYTLTSRTPRLGAGRATNGEDLPAMTPGPAPPQDFPDVAPGETSPIMPPVEPSPYVPQRPFAAPPSHVIPQLQERARLGRPGEASVAASSPYVPPAPFPGNLSSPVVPPHGSMQPPTWGSRTRPQNSSITSSPYVGPSAFPVPNTQRPWVPPTGRSRSDSVDHSPYVPPEAMMPRISTPQVGTTYIPAVATGSELGPTPQPFPRHSRTGSSALSEQPTVANNPIPVPKPGPPSTKAFVPPAGVFNKVQQSRMARPKGDRGVIGMGISAARGNMPRPFAAAAVAAAPQPPPPPTVTESEEEPVIPSQTRPRSGSGDRPRPVPAETKSILKKQAAVFPEVPYSPAVPVRQHRGQVPYEQYTNGYQNAGYGYRTPGPTNSQLTMTPGATHARLGTADPWQNAPEDFYPPVRGHATQTPKTAISDFNKDFKTPKTIFEPMGSEQSSLYDPGSPVGDRDAAFGGGATPAVNNAPLPAWGGTSSSNRPPPTGGTTHNAFIPPEAASYALRARPNGGIQMPRAKSPVGYVPAAQSYGRPNYKPARGQAPKTPKTTVSEITDEDEVGPQRR